MKGNNRTYYAQGVQSTLNIDYTTGEFIHDCNLVLDIIRMEWIVFKIKITPMNDGIMFQTAQNWEQKAPSKISPCFGYSLQYNLKYKGLISSLVFATKK